MCTYIKFAFLLTVLTNVNCDKTITIRTFQPVDKMERTPAAVTIQRATAQKFTFPLRQWFHENITQIPTITTTAVSNRNDTTNTTSRTWEPVDTVIPTNTNIASTTEKDTTPRFVDLSGACPFYSPVVVPFHIQKMADIWQTVYFKLDDKVQCFKIHIKRVTDDERYIYNEKYGSFDGEVNWNNVYLEIKAVTKIDRRHFLQGGDESRGILKNVIITEDEETHYHTYQAESSDQWMVFQKLLLMRDCETGGVVVFAKVPHVPPTVDIMEAFELFGETYEKGRKACDDQESANKFYEADDFSIEDY